MVIVASFSIGILLPPDVQMSGTAINTVNSSHVIGILFEWYVGSSIIVILFCTFYCGEAMHIVPPPELDLETNSYIKFNEKKLSYPWNRVKRYLNILKIPKESGRNFLCRSFSLTFEATHHKHARTHARTHPPAYRIISYTKKHLTPAFTNLLIKWQFSFQYHIIISKSHTLHIWRHANPKSNHPMYILSIQLLIPQ